MSEPVVLLRHCVGVDGQPYCARGLREFMRRHGLDVRVLARQGYPASVIEATGDAMAQRAAGNARAEHQTARAE